MARRLGVRGNREHFGASPQATPHVVTSVVRCRSCDFIYSDPAIEGLEHVEAAFYDDPDDYTAFEGIAAREVVARRLRWATDDARPGRLLDVGAGKGEFVLEATRIGWQAMGVEPSARFCEHAREKLGVQVQRGRLGEPHVVLPGRFDLVTLNHVLEHVAAPITLLGTARELLAAGGRLFVEVPNCDSLLLRAADLFFRLQGRRWSTRLSPLHPPYHSFGYTAPSLRFALEQAGYRAIRIKTFPGSERGYRSGKGSWGGWLRSAAQRGLGILGNRELLCATAAAGTGRA